MIDGLVPEIELREASVFAGYSWDRWSELPWQERARTVAHYRLHNLIDIHRNDALSAEMERRSKKAGR